MTPEQKNTKFEDLAPTLQTLINSKMSNDQLKQLTTKVETLEAETNGVAFTIMNGRPDAPLNNKNLNLNLNTNVLEHYTGGAWNISRICFL